MQKFLVKKGFIFFVILMIFVGGYLVNLSTSYSNKDKFNIKHLHNEILSNNTILNESSELLNGLFYDNASNTYYFKGNVENNYIVINNELWRIVMINNDKSVKIIKAYGIDSNKLFNFNEEYDDYEYIDSIVMNELELWYNNNLNNIDSYIKEDEYCVNYKNECISTEKMKISLLNVMEVKRAGGNNNINNEAYYLHNGNDWWIIDNDYDEFLGSAYSGYVNLMGSIEKGFVDEQMTIRPVITLIDSVSIAGNGTVDDPYFILD